MSDTTLLAKCILVIGILVLFVTLLSAQPPANAPPLPADNGYNQLSQNLQRGPPPFQDPISAPALTISLVPVADGSNPPYNTTGCPIGSFYKCVVPGANETSSFLTLWPSRPVGGNTTIQLSNGAGGDTSAVIVTAQIRIVCNLGANATQDLGISVYFSPHANGTGPTIQFGVMQCQRGPPKAQYANSTGLLGFREIFGNLTNSFIVIQVPGSSLTGPVENFYSVQVTFGLSWQRLCATLSGLDGIGCQIQQAFALGATFLTYLANGFIFVGGIAVWFLTLIYGFITGVGSSFLWILTIPGEPPIVVGLIGAFIVAIAATVIFIVASRVRGVGNLG